MLAARYSSLWRMALLVIAGLAVMAQSAIPAGFMPGIGQQTGSFITICSTMGEETVFMPGDPDGHESQRTGESCAYAFMLSATGTVPVLTPVYVAARLLFPIQESVSPFVVVFGVDPTHPPTGPPAVV